MKKVHILVATPLLLLCTFALFLFLLPMTQLTVEAQRQRNPTRAEKTATPEGFVATPSPTPGIKPAGGGCGDSVNYAEFDFYGYLGFVINSQADLVTIYGDPEYLDVLPEHTYQPIAVYPDYYTQWMVTVDDTWLFDCFGIGNNYYGEQKSSAQSHLWSHEDLSAPLGSYDVYWFEVQSSPYGDVFFGLHYIEESGRQAIDIINIEDPMNPLQLFDNSHVVDASWSIDGLLTVIMTPSLGESQRELLVVDPFSGEVYFSQPVAEDTVNILMADEELRVWTATYERVSLHDLPYETSSDMFAFAPVTSNNSPDLLAYWNFEWTRFVLPKMSNTGQVYIYDTVDIENPIILDMSEAFPEGKQILSVAWTEDGDEVLIGVEGSVAWWSFEEDTPTFVDLIPITLAGEDIDGTEMIFGADPKQVYWLLDDTMIVVVTEDDFFDDSLHILDLTNTDPQQVIKIEWDAINFSEDQERANIIMKDGRLMALDLITLDLTEVGTFHDIEPYFDPIPTPNPAPDFACEGALAPHLLNGQNAIVIAGGTLEVYAEASYNSEKLGILPENATVSIVDGPVCGDNGDVLYAIFGSYAGWVTASSNGEYWIVAIEDIPSRYVSFDDDTSVVADGSVIATEEPSDSNTVDSQVEDSTAPSFTDMLIIYDDISFTVVNVSGQDANFNELTFISDSGIFLATDWENEFLSYPLTVFPTDSCLQIWAQGYTDLPSPLECGTRQNWVSGSQMDNFWLDSPTFDVFVGDVFVMTCEVSIGTCEVDLP